MNDVLKIWELPSAQQLTNFHKMFWQYYRRSNYRWTPTKTLLHDEIVDGDDLEWEYVEASGISDPAPIERDLNFVSSRIDRSYDLKANICLIDASTFMDLIQIIEVLQKQILYADLILINKIDLVSSADLSVIQKLIKEAHCTNHDKTEETH